MKPTKQTNRELEISAFAKEHNLTFDEACDIIFLLGVDHLKKEQQALSTSIPTFFKKGVDHPARKLVRRTTIIEEFERI